MENVITLNLTVAEINTILGVLGKAPFEAVSAVIANIQIQAKPQVDAISKS